MKQILIIANPVASRGGAVKALAKIRQYVHTHSDCCSFDFMVTENPMHATDLAKLHSRDYDLVVAFGGDGTVHEVAQGLVGGSTPMGVIPFGTGNDFARSAGIPLDLKSAVDFLCQGTPLPTDLGLVNGHYFVNGVGIGFDGRTNYEAAKIRHLKGPVVILIAIFQTMRFWKAVPIRIMIDGQTLTSDTYLVAIGNGDSIGGGLKLTPSARLNDAKLHICHVGDITRRKIIWNFPRLKTGTVEKVSEVTLFSGKNVTVESDYPLPVHADGEFMGLDLHKIELQIVPSALKVIRQSKPFPEPHSPAEGD